MSRLMKIELAVSLLMIVLGAFLFTMRGADDLIGKVLMLAGGIGNIHVGSHFIKKTLALWKK